MEIKIRTANPEDFNQIEQILKQNNMLDYPETDGKKAMQRIHKIMPKYFLVYEMNNQVLGMVRGCYDGSRALIHQIAVDPDYQKRGIGKQLINAIYKEFKKDNATSVSITVSEKNIDYFKSLGFKNINISLMIKD